MGNKNRWMLEYYNFSKHEKAVPTDDGELHVSPIWEIIGWMQQFGRDSIPRSTDEISGGSRFPDG